jgi:hypothetical protein
MTDDGSAPGEGDLHALPPRHSDDDTLAHQTTGKNR